MNTVGTFEAKTHLTRLLERVAKGERIVITHRGKPVAMLVPLEAGVRADSALLGREMLAYRDRMQRRLGETFRDLAHEGIGTELHRTELHRTERCPPRSPRTISSWTGPSPSRGSTTTRRTRTPTR